MGVRDYTTQLAETKLEIAHALSDALYDHPRVQEIPPQAYPPVECERWDFPLPVEFAWAEMPTDELPKRVEYVTLHRHLWNKDYHWLYVWYGTDKRTGTIYFAAIPRRIRTLHA